MLHSLGHGIGRGGAGQIAQGGGLLQVGQGKGGRSVLRRGKVGGGGHGHGIDDPGAQQRGRVIRDAQHLPGQRLGRAALVRGVAAVDHVGVLARRVPQGQVGGEAGLQLADAAGAVQVALQGGVAGHQALAAGQGDGGVFRLQLHVQRAAAGEGPGLGVKGVAQGLKGGHGLPVVPGLIQLRRLVVGVLAQSLAALGHERVGLLQSLVGLKQRQRLLPAAGSHQGPGAADIPGRNGGLQRLGLGRAVREGPQGLVQRHGALQVVCLRQIRRVQVGQVAAAVQERIHLPEGAAGQIPLPLLQRVQPCGIQRVLAGIPVPAQLIEQPGRALKVPRAQKTLGLLVVVLVGGGAAGGGQCQGQRRKKGDDPFHKPYLPVKHEDSMAG